MVKREITIKITCETNAPWRELEENLDYFREALQNIEGNIEGFSFKETIKEIKAKKK